MMFDVSNSNCALYTKQSMDFTSARSLVVIELVTLTTGALYATAIYRADVITLSL